MNKELMIQKLMREIEMDFTFDLRLGLIDRVKFNSGKEVIPKLKSVTQGGCVSVFNNKLNYPVFRAAEAAFFIK